MHCENLNTSRYSLCSRLPPANEVWGKVIFLHQFVILFTGGVCVVLFGGGMRGFIQGACVVLFRGRAWFYSGACMVLFGGHAWFYLGACVVLFGGRAWFYLGGCAWFYSGGMHGFIWGGMCGFIRGACMVLFGGCAWFYSGGMHGFIRGGHAWFFQFFQIQWDTVNERAVRILLECILVVNVLINYFNQSEADFYWSISSSSVFFCPEWRSDMQCLQ